MQEEAKGSVNPTWSKSMTSTTTSNRRLTEEEREHAQAILQKVRQEISKAAIGDEQLVWAIRRYVYIRLQHDGRGKPAQRKILKLKKMVSQKGKCTLCGKELPERGAELDRYDAMKGYTEENTRLLCHSCHREDQAKRGFA